MRSYALLFLGLVYFYILSCSLVFADGEYFPDSIFGTKTELPIRYARYARDSSDLLRAMKEPSLWQRRVNEKQHAYRFLWKRTFHNPIAIRLDVQEDESGILTIKVMSGAGGYDWGHLKMNESINVTKAQVNEFLKRIQDCKFWDLPTSEERRGGRKDGATWIIEGIKNGKYHIVKRWCPKDSEFGKAALFLVEMAKLKVDRVY